MVRRQGARQQPPLRCGDCDSPVVKTTDSQFVCVGCDRTYRWQRTRWTQRNHHGRLDDAGPGEV